MCDCPEMSLITRMHVTKFNVLISELKLSCEFTYFKMGGYHNYTILLAWKKKVNAVIG